MKIPTLREVLEVIIVAVILFFILTSLSSCTDNTYNVSVVITYTNGDFDQIDFTVDTPPGVKATTYHFDLDDECLQYSMIARSKTLVCGVRKYKILNITKR